MHRIVVRVAQFFVTLVVGLAILGSLTVWRLSKGPVSLDFLTPTIERGFAAHELPVAVQVDSTTLVWGGLKRVFDLRAVNVRLFGGDGKIVALLPEVSVGVSLTGLLRGDFALSRLDVFGLRALVTRHRDGRLDFALPVDPRGEADGADAFAAVAADLLKSVREGQGLFRYLSRFSVLSAKVKYVDELNRQFWEMPAADMITVFGPEVIESQFRMVVENNGDQARVAATVLHDRKSARIGGRVDFGPLEPTFIARAMPHLTRLSDIRLPFVGSAHFEVSAAWRLLGMRLQLATPVGRALIGLEYPPKGSHVHVVARLEDVHLAGLARATPALAPLAGIDLRIDGQIEGDALSAEAFRLSRVDLAAGQGAVELPGILPRSVGVSGMRLRAGLSDDQSKIVIGELSLDLDGPSLRIAGTADRDGPLYRLRAEATVSDLPMAALDDYWPVGLGPVARQWVVANIVDGAVDGATVALSAAVPADNPLDIEIEDIRGTMRYRGLSVDYLAPMPKITGIAGEARFDRTRMELSAGSAQLRDLILERATVSLSDLDTDDEKIAIDLSLKGPARTLAQVLDEKPLGFLGALTVSPAAITGESDLRARLNFPLHRNLTAKEIKLAATGTFHKFAVAPAPYGLEVKDGTLSVTASDDGLAATGNVLLSGMRTSVEWREDFAADAAERRRLTFATQVADMGKPGFGLPPLDFLSGPGKASVVLTQRREGEGRLAVDIGLTETALDLPALGWKKAAGEPGTAKVALSLDTKGLRKIDSVTVETGDDRLVGSAEAFGAEREAWIATVERFESGGNDLRGRIELRPGGAIRADLTGGRFDVAGLMESRSAGAARKEPALPPITVRARIRDLRWEAARQVRDARVMMRYVDGRVQGLTLDGRFGGDGTLGIRYLPGPDGRVLRVAADDFGTLLAMSPSRSRVTGGALVIRGVQRDLDGPLEGDFHASNFTLSQAPVLARVLQVASLTGIVDALSRKGLVFEALEGQFAYSDERIVFAKASAYGSSIGVTGDGVLDLGKDTLSVSGTVVPAYSLNRVLGQIPVLGSIITGGKNEGLFAATYRVEGPIEDAKVQVNPLSALAPGFLRDLFGLGPAKEPAMPGKQ